MKLFATLALLACSFFSSAQIQRIALEDAAKHAGSTVNLRGKIIAIQHLKEVKGTPTNIYLGAAFPNQKLTLVIAGDVRKQLGFDLSDKKLLGGMAVVTGKLQVVKGKPQIIITDPAQLVILIDEEVKSTELPKLDQRR